MRSRREILAGLRRYQILEDDFFQARYKIFVSGLVRLCRRWFIYRQKYVSGRDRLLDCFKVFAEDSLFVSMNLYLPSISVFADVSVARSADREISIHDLRMIRSPSQILK